MIGTVAESFVKLYRSGQSADLAADAECVISRRIKDSRFLFRATLIPDKGNGEMIAAFLQIDEKVVGNFDVAVVIINIRDPDKAFVAIPSHQPIDEVR